MKIVLRILLGFLVLLGLLWGMWLQWYYQKDRSERSAYWMAIQSRYVQGSGAEQFFTQWAIDNDPTNAEAWMQQSIAHNKRGDYATGMAFLEKAVELRPLEHLGYRGWVKLFMLRDYDGALADLHRLDQMTPGVADAPWGEDIYFLLGLCHLQKDQLDSARYWIDYSIESTTAGPGEDWVDVAVFYYAGLVRFLRKEPAKAQMYFEKAIHYSRRFAEAYYYLALLAMDRGAQDEACQLLQKGEGFFLDGYRVQNPYFAYPYALYPTDFRQLGELCPAFETPKK
ncbi:MAG: tetratricopeptide repeat protein [Bacteroidota bacterium]